jgi:hypothetical protein
VSIPSATISTTVAMGMRKPRMQGTSPILSRSTVMRVNVIRAARSNYLSYRTILLCPQEIAPFAAGGGSRSDIYRSPRLSAVLAQSGFAGADDGLGAVCDLQLGEDVGDVVADGLGTQVEALRYLGVGLVGGL